jgi:hypothetical protein
MEYWFFQKISTILVNIPKISHTNVTKTLFQSYNSNIYLSKNSHFWQEKSNFMKTEILDEVW